MRPLQLVPGTPHTTSQRPALQVCPAAQALPHMPQWARVATAVSRHMPLQLFCPLGHDTWQRLARHTSPWAQALPHAPQWARSVCTSRHAPAQLVRLPSQLSSQRPAAHT
jgi:hypothetical protein